MSELETNFTGYLNKEGERVHDCEICCQEFYEDEGVVTDYNVQCNECREEGMAEYGFFTRTTQTEVTS